VEGIRDKIDAIEKMKISNYSLSFSCSSSVPVIMMLNQRFDFVLNS
jgi:hypothetical protein